MANNVCVTPFLRVRDLSLLVAPLSLPRRPAAREDNTGMSARSGAARVLAGDGTRMSNPSLVRNQGTAVCLVVVETTARLWLLDPHAITVRGALPYANGVSCVRASEYTMADHVRVTPFCTSP